METPIVSVLMPVYNSSHYLRESIDSVLQQSFADFEFLIIDDGSTDDSVRIVESYHDSRIRLILNKHDYINSLNTGIRKSRGKYIARMDSDDVMMPERLKIQAEFMEQNPEIAVCGSFAESFGTGTDMMRGNVNHNELITSMLLYNPMIHPSIIMRRSVFNTIEYDRNYPYAEDYKLWTDLAINGYRFANIHEILLKYRLSDTQVTAQRGQEMMQTAIRIQMEYAECVMEKITEKDERYWDFFNQLIELVNSGLIKRSCFSNILYCIYLDILK